MTRSCRRLSRAELRKLDSRQLRLMCCAAARILVSGFVDPRVMNAIEVGEKFADGIGDVNAAYSWCLDSVQHSRKNATLGLYCCSRVALLGAINVTPLLPDKGRGLLKMMTPAGTLRITPELRVLAGLWYDGADCLNELYDELEYAGNIIERKKVWKGWWVVDAINSR